MAATRIATTRSRDLQALVTAGQSMLDVWRTLSTLLATRLSAEHARLLAEPVPNPARGKTDWYSEGDEPAVPFTSLSPEQREAARQKLDHLVEDIRKLAEQLRTSRTENERPFAELFDLALRIPSESSIYLQGERPILVAWGHARSGQDAGSVELRGRRSLPPPPMALLPAPAPAFVSVAVRRFTGLALGLLGTAIVLLALSVVLVMRDPFGWFDVVTPACTVAESQTSLLADLRERMARGGTLRGMLADLTQDAGHRRLQCPPVQAPAPPPVQPAGDLGRVLQQGGHVGKLQIILAWNDKSDLDLHVFCPSGEEIYHSKKETCGGHLDIDANRNEPTSSDTPVENVYFDAPAAGRYRIVVDPYSLRPPSRAETAFRVTIRREGQPDQVITGVAKSGQRNLLVQQFQVPGA